MRVLTPDLVLAKIEWNTRDDVEANLNGIRQQQNQQIQRRQSIRNEQARRAADIAILERRAAAGFRSAEEEARARSGGFATAPSASTPTPAS